MYITIPILDAAELCGLQLCERTIGRREVEANCPFCGERKYHLFLNTERNQFYCQFCKTSGNSITLYAMLKGVDNKQAYRDLTQKVPFHDRKPYPTAPYVEMYTPKPLYQRHDVYFDLLSMLNLSKCHEDDLLRRGLTHEAIRQNMYKSMPDAKTANKVADALSHIYDLQGIPGFYTSYNKWRMRLYDGFLIPVCDKDGFIQGLQIRLDNPDNRKYRWFSSRYFENGARTYSWVHIAYPQNDIPKETVCITEGALKADIASLLSGRLFTAVPGTNALDYLPETLRSLNVKRAVDTLDMDKTYKAGVARAQREIQQIVLKENISFIPYEWDPRWNGIDDYLNRNAA